MTTEAIRWVVAGAMVVTTIVSASWTRNWNLLWLILAAALITP